jgi:hypothetical protein
MKRRHVYFIKPVGMDGPVKIGSAVRYTERVSQISLWSPFELELVAHIEGGQLLEDRFHAYFIDDHYRQEWFHYTPRMGEVIRAVQDGTFDVSILPPSLGPIRHAARYRSTETPEEVEYRRLYAECTNLPWQRGLSWPIVPSIFKTFSPEKRRETTERLRANIAERQRLAA